GAKPTGPRNARPDDRLSGEPGISMLQIPGSRLRRAPEMTLSRRPLGLLGALVLVQPRHDLDEVAGPRPVIELGREDAVPRIAAGARGSRQAEDKGGAGDARGGAALDRRG